MEVTITEDFLGAEDDADLVEWLVADGETVSIGQPIAGLETAKTTVQFESPASGAIRFKANTGDVVEAGDVIAVIG